ncbi:MAG TPA: CocE/NonD family hydrolase [Blastocatellia bacterium]|nr:CocE/NonD family hydrolase [Blastocatellia bacterium]
MNKLFCGLLASLFVAVGAKAQTVEGDWQGTIKANNVELRLRLHVTKDDTGALKATFDSIDQGARGLPISAISLKDSTLKFERKVAGWSYEGKVNADHTRISGTWTQGGRSFPLEFTRITAFQETEKKTPKPSDIDGAWIGGLSKLRIVLHIIAYEDGMTAKLDSPDQDLFGIPVTTITRDGAELKFEIKSIAACYEGKINPELTTISGTWEQEGDSFALVLKRTSAFPKPEDAVTEHKEVLVPMRDGARLATDLYFPSSPSNNLPVVLDRTPYNKAIFGPEAKFWTSRGYVYAVQDVRGRFRSEGRFEPYLREGPDGFDTIEWLARQPWCSGKVGTIGMSYDGLVQWQAAVERPPHLAAMVVNCSPSDRAPYEQGVMGFMPEMQWLYILRSQKPEDSSPLTAIDSFWPAFEKALDDLPVAEQDLKVFGHVDEFWRKWCSEGPESDYWKSARYLGKLDQVTVPVLHQSGWFDGDGLGTMRNYLAMMKLGAKNQRLILGPWGHTDTSTREERGRDFGEAALLDLEQEYADWFAHWLKGEAAPDGDPVKLFVMGENRWMTAASYPPPGQPKKYFLGSDFALLPDRGDSRSGRDQYVYDPGDPTPSPRMLGDEMESRYGEMLKERKDIVAYRTAPIQEPFRILGPMSAVIYVSSDVPETDIVVRISEEDPSHKSFLLAEGISRVRFNGKKPARVEVELWHTAIRIAKGNRLVVDIASASFPVYARNLNTGENSLTTTVHRKAKVTLHRSAEFPSFVELSSVTEVGR